MAASETIELFITLIFRYVSEILLVNTFSYIMKQPSTDALKRNCSKNYWKPYGDTGINTTGVSYE